MADLFWTLAVPASAEAPYIIQLVLAEDHAAACAAFSLPAHSPRCARLTTPSLVALMRGATEGVVVSSTVSRLPSAYDRFAPDYEPGAMRDAGFDPT